MKRKKNLRENLNLKKRVEEIDLKRNPGIMIEKRENTNRQINTRKIKNTGKLGRGKTREGRIGIGTKGERIEVIGIVNIGTRGTIGIGMTGFGTIEFGTIEFGMIEFGTTEFGTIEFRIDITKIDTGTPGTTETEKTDTVKTDTEKIDTVTNDTKPVQDAIGQGLQSDLRGETQKNLRQVGTTKTTENIIKTEFTPEKKNEKKVQVLRENTEVLRRPALQVPTLPPPTLTAAPAQVTILTVPAVLLTMMKV